MTNIKNIGKELMGKSLNSFHRKTGLTQLEKNNEMQDGILNGILSQADDAYIEKTEQSNVLHLDGSGDGVVVLDSVEGNTMVNLMGKHTYLNNATYDSDNDSLVINQTNTNKAKICFDNALIEPKKTYTVQFNIVKNTLVNSDTSSNRCAKLNLVSYNQGTFMVEIGTVGTVKVVLPQPSDTTHNGKPYFETFTTTTGELIIKDFVALEGDWSDREIPTFKGLQSSFEENITDEGQYKFEILSNNKNLLNIGKIEKNIGATSHPAKITVKNNKVELNNSDGTSWIRGFYKVKVKPNTKYIFTSMVTKGMVVIYKGSHLSNNFSWDTNYIYSYLNYSKQENRECIMRFTTDSDEEYIYIRFSNEGVQGVSIFESPMVEKSENETEYNPHKQNKIKLLINEPLRAIGNKKDKLCVKDGKLVVERRCGFKELGKAIYNEGFGYLTRLSDDYYRFQAPESNKYLPNINTQNYVKNNVNNFPIYHSVGYEALSEGYYIDQSIVFRVHKDRIGGTSISDFRRWAKDKDLKIVYPLKNAYYEEVLNEYGEPILLEGYENGTLYIDSTIVPITTVRYTPKMESFKAIKEVKSNNSLLSNDINESIIPYMMEVDMLIMEKEMSLFSSLNKNIRKMEVLDMTSMQKRTGEMLTRLIKGKTLNEQECKTRVAVYLNAGKITDEQAKELNFLIDEIYA